MILLWYEFNYLFKTDYLSLVCTFYNDSPCLKPIYFYFMEIKIIVLQEKIIHSTYLFNFQIMTMLSSLSKCKVPRMAYFSPSIITNKFAVPKQTVVLTRQISCQSSIKINNVLSFMTFVAWPIDRLTIYLTNICLYIKGIYTDKNQTCTYILSNGREILISNTMMYYS